MKEVKKKSGLGRLLEIAGERRWLLALAGLLSGVSALCALVPYWAVYEVLGALLRHVRDGVGLDAGGVKEWGWVALWGLGGALVTLYASLMASHKAAFRILYGLRIRLAEHIGRLSLGYLNGTTTGAIKKTLDQNVEKVEGFVAHTIPDIVNVVVSIVVMMCIFFSMNVWMALCCLVVVVLCMVVQVSCFFGEGSKEKMKRYFDEQEKMSASAVQYVRGMPVVKIFGQSVMSFRQFHSEIEAYKKFALEICDGYERGMVIFSVLLNSLATFFLPVGTLIWMNTPETLAFAAVWVFFLILGPGMATPIYKLMYLGNSINEIGEGVARLDKILEREGVKAPEVGKEPRGHEVEFQNVSFGYENEGARTWALKNVSIVAKEGEVTALVGPSGGGKSTVASLIPRFWDVDLGEILIGGVNIKEIKTERLMEMVGFVFQESFLFHDTVYENIAVGKRGASNEEVVAAAKAVQCHEFIMALEEGYMTKIGEDGVQLSGGEAQRVCVAHAILRGAPILVLDEATAFADAENEQKMQAALSNLMAGRTVIVIKLCARFYDPAGGVVTMGGVDMRSVNPEKLMARISMVFQDVYLFEGTIGDNIRFGKAGATDAEVVEAAKKARCHEFIMRLPKGYDTRVGEGGCTLSGGERQRLSIARAFLKDAEVVLLDEATASLDAENEREVQLAIDGLVRGRTVVVIAHKLKTVRGADKIVVLKDGEVEEMGKHEDLMWNKGLYWRLWNMQEEASGWKM